MGKTWLWYTLREAPTEASGCSEAVGLKPACRHTSEMYSLIRTIIDLNVYVGTSRKCILHFNRSMRATECSCERLSKSAVCMVVRRSCLLFVLLYLLNWIQKTQQMKSMKRNPPCWMCLCSIYDLLERRRAAVSALFRAEAFSGSVVPKMGSFRTKSRLLLVFPCLKSKVLKARLFLLNLNQQLFDIWDVLI